jgi:serine/threonine protein kinase
MAVTLAGGRFVLEGRLGEGGQAAVFRVRDVRLGVDRALKVLLPRFAAKPKVRARFANEARSMALLEHKNIVQVYDVETEGALPYMVMELLPGGSVAQWIEAMGPFPPRQGIAMALEVCAGLGAAHAAHIIHRDIKPQNILITAEGSCKITDFGIARTEEGHRTKIGAALGTQGYMAPEQSRDATTVDVRSDVYSVAITLFVLLTGHDPIEWITGRYRDWIPDPLLPVLDRATSDDPDDRQRSIEHLARELKEALGQLPEDPQTLPIGTQRPSHVETQGPFDFTEILPLLDDDRSTVFPQGERSDARPPASRSQRLNVAPNTPEWVDRSHAAAPARPFVVDLDTGELKASQLAKERRERIRMGLPPQATTMGESLRPAVVLWNLLRALLHPMRSLPVLFTVGLVLGTYAFEQNWTARRAVASALDSRGKLHRALEAEHTLLDTLDGLGADTLALSALYGRWQTAREPEKSQLALQVVDELDRLSEKAAQPGVTAWESANREVRRLRVAKDLYQKQADQAVASSQRRWVMGVPAP